MFTFSTERLITLRETVEWFRAAALDHGLRATASELDYLRQQRDILDQIVRAHEARSIREAA